MFNVIILIIVINYFVHSIYYLLNTMIFFKPAINFYIFFAFFVLF